MIFRKGDFRFLNLDCELKEGSRFNFMFYIVIFLYIVGNKCFNKIIISRNGYLKFKIKNKVSY